MGIRFEHMTSEEWLKDKKLRDSAHEESVTSMFDCTHGPKKDCHACIVGELVEALERLLLYVTDVTLFEAKYGAAEFPDSSINVEWWLDEKVRTPARAVLEKAKLIEDCIPLDEAEEASRT